MVFIILDDELPALNRLKKSVYEVLPEAEIHAFQSAEEALEYAENNRFDAAFLDIQGLDMDGISLAKKIKMIKPKTNIIFTTGYSEYAMDAMNLYASGYLLKPITAEKVSRAIEELRYPPVSAAKSGLRVRCFGNFEAFVGEEGKRLNFRHTKTKELLAYLIDRMGAVCSNGELQAILWEDSGDHSNYLKQLRKDLIDTFKQYELDHLVEKARGGMGIRFDEIDSDLRDWKLGLPEGINAFHGEYMAQYSWGEYRMSVLTGII